MSVTKLMVLVDDDWEIAEVFRHVLRESVQVLQYTSTEGFLLDARKIRADAWVVDLLLPAASGLDLIERARAWSLKLPPIAVISGVVLLDAPMERELDRLGISLWFKPLGPEEIRRIARSLNLVPSASGG